tara:strand:- start:153 stop:500 length:348 start_codon:yes stop_codon:yes gene_type:complete
MNVIIISVFSLFVLSQLPWWFIVVTSSMAGLISKNYVTSILNGFACGSSPWAVMFIYKLYMGGELIIVRVSSMIGFDHWIGAFCATFVIGGICGIMGSICAFSFKIAFDDQLTNS